MLCLVRYATEETCRDWAPQVCAGKWGEYRAGRVGHSTADFQQTGCHVQHPPLPPSAFPRSRIRDWANKVMTCPGCCPGAQGLRKADLVVRSAKHIGGRYVDSEPWS